MTLTKLNIPNKINVGFVKRGGTYTGKLAYVVYTDIKGKLRKEKSWNDWRNHEIAAKEFENEPTDGFVLNRKAGGGNYGWHSRQTKVRVYDPRDFEFEIKVENLLFILEECSAIKGKGLEGEFVYAWDGADIILLPVSSQEYTASKAHTEMQTKKVTKKDIVEGCLYRTKSGEIVMYLGRHPWYYTSHKSIRVEVPQPTSPPTAANQWNYRYSRYKWEEVITKHSTKKHIFVSLDKKIETYAYSSGSNYAKHHYWVQPGFTKLGERLSEEPSPEYPAEYEKFLKSKHGKPRKAKKVKSKK